MNMARKSSPAVGPWLNRRQASRSLAKFAVVLCLVAGLALPMVRAAPGITITGTPPYNSQGNINGIVTGVPFSSYQVAGYILVPGVGWYTKPYSQAPTVPINPDGTFALDVTTGGLDAIATIFCASLVPTNEVPPLALGTGRVPEDTNSVAMTFVERYGPTVSFANRTWAIKNGPLPVGPGPNYFSTNSTSVWVSNGLHLTIAFTNTPDATNVWVSTELTLLDHLGYGTYSFKTTSRNDLLDASAVFGAFTWDDYGDDDSIPAWPYREMDFEDSIWGVAGGPDTQYVVQPYYVSGNRHQYYFPNLSTNSTVTRIMTWEPGIVRFVTLSGDQPATNFPQNAVVQEYTVTNNPSTGNLVPQPGRERFHFNLYLANGASPAGGNPVEVTISDFEFIPLPPQITSVQAMGRDLIINFACVYGTSYALQARTNLSTGAWTDLPNTYVGTGGILSITNTNALLLPAQFFRFRRLP